MPKSRALRSSASTWMRLSSFSIPFEGLGRSHLVDEMAVDVEQAGAVVLGVDHMGVPDLVVKRLAGHESSPHVGIRGSVTEGATGGGRRSKRRQHRQRRAEEPPGQARAVVHVEDAFHRKRDTRSPRVPQAPAAGGAASGPPQFRAITEPSGHIEI